MPIEVTLIGRVVNVQMFGWYLQKKRHQGN